MNSNSSEAITRDVRVRVAPRFIPERSDPARREWFFVYTVDIANLGTQPVTLMSRRWVITDAMGEVREVEGPGVVGEQPKLEPGQSFRYTSACPLPTSLGTMHGSYRMIRDDGVGFDAEIGRFTLVDPSTLN